MLPVVVVLVLVWVGVWVQFRVTVEVTLPVSRMPSAPDTPSTGTWTTPRPALTGMSLLQSWTGSWLPLAFTRLSLLKPLGPELGPWLIGPPMGPGAAAVLVLPVVVV